MFYSRQSNTFVLQGSLLTNQLCGLFKSSHEQVCGATLLWEGQLEPPHIHLCLNIGVVLIVLPYVAGNIFSPSEMTTDDLRHLVTRIVINRFVTHTSLCEHRCCVCYISLGGNSFPPNCLMTTNERRHLLTSDNEGQIGK